MIQKVRSIVRINTLFLEIIQKYIHTIVGEGQTLFRDWGPGDISAQVNELEASQLIALMDFGRNAGMRREAIYLAAPLFRIACGQGLWRKHFAPLSRTNGDSIHFTRRYTQALALQSEKIADTNLPPSGEVLNDVKPKKNQTPVARIHSEHSSWKSHQTP